MPTATMAPSPSAAPRSTKRLKRTHPTTTRTAAPPPASLGSLSLPHPLNIKPAGNALLSSGPPTRHLTLGALAALPDEVITHILTVSRGEDSDEEEAILGPRDLAALSMTSHGLRAFANSEGLWRNLFVQVHQGRMQTWKGSWKQTFGAHQRQRRDRPQHAGDTPPLAAVRPQQPFFSDSLYLPHRLSLLRMERYIPADADADGAPTRTRTRYSATPIPRLPASVPLEEFHAQYAARNRPCILGAPKAASTSGAPTGASHEVSTSASPAGPALPGLGMDIPRLRDVYAKRWVRAEAIRTTVQVYAEYARGCARQEAVLRRAAAEAEVEEESEGEEEGEEEKQEEQADDDPAYDPMSVPDEAPFYLFDSQLPAQMDRDGLWTVPAQIQACPAGVYGVPGLDAADKGAGREDGDTASLEGIAPRTSLDATSRSKVEADLFSLLSSSRPDHRWLIAGPARSGSGWHKDPNYTSAWNAPLSGRKLWLMLPPSVTPPGVYVSEDGGEVTAPLSLAEWLDNFWEEALRLHGKGKHGDGALQHAVCGPGETVYVPSGWWHLVVNLEESVALTQNFVSLAELPQVLWFMRERWDQISGFRSEAAAQRAGGERSKRSEEEEEEEDNEPDDDALCTTSDPRRGLHGTFLAALRAYSPALAEWASARAGEIQAGSAAAAEDGFGAGAGEVQPKAKTKKRDAEGEGAGTWWERLKAGAGAGAGEGGGSAAAAAAEGQGQDEGAGAGAGGLFSGLGAGLGAGGEGDEELEMGDVPW